MGRPSGSTRKEARIADGAGADRFTALPIELRAHIVSFLPYREIVQLSVLSRPWMHIHHYTPVVKLNLDEFLFFDDIMLDEGDEDALPGVVDDGLLVGLRVALRRRAQEGSGCTVDALRIAYAVDDRRMRRHADRIIALVDARRIRVTVPYNGRTSRDAWTLALPAAARYLDVAVFGHLSPAITGPGAAALLNLRLEHVVLREWPCLPSLRSLTLNTVTVEAPLPPGAWSPLLEYLSIFNSKIEQARVDIRLPLLKSLDLDLVDVSAHGDSIGSPFGDITVDAPRLEDLEVICIAGCAAEYKSFTLRAPMLRYLYWHNQFAERVAIDVGSPGSVTAGKIQFEWNHESSCRELKSYKAQMMRMLEGLIPELSPERVAHAARPHMTLDKYTVEGTDFVEDGKMIPEERLACDLDAIMSSLKD
ncbi:hypothetical protein SETIT_2G093700v2 [Setaria italica]|uniref:F-box domain-containing protein n=1 Tax=Setaria italica TaxID=4555 RepID=K3ZTL8_SETIT|nr:uncharacterized protein LOC101755472 [Setaria italica]RCV10205.1 hypothetical protein SETIT_2G093700v2 [Setaria italica]